MATHEQTPTWRPIPIAGNLNSEQNRQLRELLESAVGRAMPLIMAQLDRRGFQHLLDFGERLTESVTTQLEELVRNQARPSELHRGEEVASQLVYLPSYRPMPIPGQVTALRKLFPELKSSACQEKLGRKILPPGAEAWYAIPRWTSIAPSYGEALERAFALLAASRRFENRILGKLGDRYLCQSERSEHAWSLIGGQQAGNDILVLPVQAGLRHRGRSARRTEVMMDSHEFGLGAFATAVLLLLSPERLGGANTLMLDCTGDEYSLLGDGCYERVPLFDMEIGGLEFSVFYRDRARPLWGAATGFVVEFP